MGFPPAGIGSIATFVARVSLESMRLLKLGMTALVAVLAVLAGLVVAAVAALAGMILFFSKRSRSEAMPHPPGTLPPRRGTRPLRSDGREVIDIVATEVPTDSVGR